MADACCFSPPFSFYSRGGCGGEPEARGAGRRPSGELAAAGGGGLRGGRREGAGHAPGVACLCASLSVDGRRRRCPWRWRGRLIIRCPTATPSSWLPGLHGAPLVRGSVSACAGLAYTRAHSLLANSSLGCVHAIKDKSVISPTFIRNKLNFSYTIIMFYARTRLCLEDNFFKQEYFLYARTNIRAYISLNCFSCLKYRYY